MLMLLAMRFNIVATRIVAILKRIAGMLPLLHHCGNIAIAKGIAAIPFDIATTPQYFPDYPPSFYRYEGILQPPTITPRVAGLSPLKGLR